MLNRQQSASQKTARSGVGHKTKIRPSFLQERKQILIVSGVSTLVCFLPLLQVAQFKATVLLMPNGSDRVTTVPPIQKLETDKKVGRRKITCAQQLTTQLSGCRPCVRVACGLNALWVQAPFYPIFPSVPRQFAIQPKYLDPACRWRTRKSSSCWRRG